MLSQKLGGLCSQHLLERRVLSMSHSPKVGSLCERAGVGHPKTKGIPGEVGGLQQRGTNALARSPETTGRLGREPQWCAQVQERQVPSEGASPKYLLKVPVRTSQSRESRPSCDTISRARTSTLSFSLLSTWPPSAQTRSQSWPVGTETGGQGKEKAVSRSYLGEGRQF